MVSSMILPLTLVIIGVIAAITAYALLSDRPRVVHSSPSILTSLGIFGTFLGITVGLAGFLPGDIAGSVPRLFEGIKLAFWTSVAGILGGILVKLRLLLFPFDAEADSTSRPTFSDLVAAMRGVQASLTDQDKSPLLASLRDLQAQSNAKADELKGSLDSLVGAFGAAAERDAAVLGTLDKMQAGSAAGFADLRKASAEDLQALAQALSQDSSTLGDRLAAALAAGQEAAGQLNEQQLEKLAQSMGKDSNALADRLSQVLGANSEALAKALEGGRDALAAQIAAAVTDLRDALVGPDGAASDLGRRLQQGQIDLATALARATEGLRAAVGEEVSGLNARLAQSSEEASSQVRGVAAAIEALQSAMGGDSAALLTRLESLREGSDALGDRISKLLGANSEALAKALEGNRDVMAAQIAAAVTDLRDALVGPDGAATELGRRMQQGQIDLATALARATDGLRAAVGSEVASLNTRLAESSEAASAQVQNVAKALESLQTAMGGDAAAMLARLESLREGSDQLGERLSRVLGDNNEALAKALAGNRDAMAAQIATAVTELRDALVGPDGAASELGKRLQQGQLELATALARATEGLRSAVGEDLGSLLQRMDSLGDGMQSLADSVSGAFGDAAGGLSGDINALNTAMADAIDDLRLALVGPEGASVGIADEIRSAQKENTKALAAIHKALEENTKRQVDYSPKALLEVLEEMVRQFNTQFSGQFWEKFDGFNQGIAQLLEWMNTYRKQLGDMTDAQTKTTRNMDVAARRFDEIASRSEIFIDVSRNMSALLGGLDSQRVQIESHLKQFAHIVDTTRENLENIEQRIVDGNEGMNTHIREIAERIEEQVIRLDTALDKELAKAMNTFGQQLAALSEKFVEDYTPLTQRLQDVLKIAKSVK